MVWGVIQLYFPFYPFHPLRLPESHSEPRVACIAAVQEVNRHVKSAMVQWIGGVVKDKFEKLVNETGEECEDTEDTFFV